MLSSNAQDLHAPTCNPVPCGSLRHCCTCAICALHDTGCCAALQVLEPILYERDRYLTWALQRSKAVNGSRLVVGVVGLMHLQGISETLLSHWESAEPLRFSEVVGSSRRRKRRGEGGPGRRLLAEAALAGAASWAWLSWHH